MSAKNTTNSLVFQIDQLLDEASTLAKTERDSAKFHSTLLQRAMLAVEAQSAAIWMLGPDSHPIAIASHRSGDVKSASKQTPTQTQLAITQTVRKCIESGRPENMTANGPSSRGTTALFCCPYDSGTGSTDSAIALQFVPQRDEKIDPNLRTIYDSFTEAIAEIAAEHGRWKTSQLETSGTASMASESSPQWNRFKSLSDALHENLDIRSTAVSLVNLGRNFYSCDRVMLAQKSGRSFKVIAVSGAATVNRKSETVGAVESLVARAFYRSDKTVVLQDASSAPPALKNALERYRSVSKYGFLLLSPLHDKNGKVKFVQVVESGDENNIGNILNRVKIADPQTQSAFRNALQYQAIPMRGLLGMIGGSRIGATLGRLFMPLALLGLAALAFVAMSLIQTDLIISADGNVLSETRKSVFAAKDGVISKLHVGHGDQVRAGQLLIEMSSNEIESEISLLRGNIATEEKRLSAIEAVKSSIDRGSREGQRELGRLSSQEIESRQQIENLEVELSQLENEKQRLQLKSPLDGIVVTRDVKTKLLNRPVERGNVLLQLIADDGKWLARIRVPDSQVSHLVNRSSAHSADKANKANSAAQTWDVPVSLSIATYPERKFEGIIRDVSNTAEVDERTGQAFIVATVELDHDDEVTFQPGSSAVAEFNCGKTSVGYAWFHEFIDSVRYRFF